MSDLDIIKKVATELKRVNIKGANYIVLHALYNLIELIQKFKDDNFISKIVETCMLFFQAQPTMTPLANCMALILESLEKHTKKSSAPGEIRHNLIKEIENLIEKYQSTLEKVIDNASSIIQSGARILTYSFSSTVFEAIKVQKKLGKKLEIFITESRPNNEGLLGAQELSKLYPTTLFIDAGIGYILKEHSIDLILIGADSFNETELIHKIGTLPLALTAREFKVPIYTLATSFKYYQGDSFNFPISIEAKSPQEIAESELETLKIENYYFDRTLLRYITGIITEEGIYDLSKGEFPPKRDFPSNSLEKLYAGLSK